MDPDENEDSVPYSPFVGIVPPEEVQKMLDRREMQHETRAHDIQRMFTEMNPDHLVTLRLILNSIATCGELAASGAAYFEGQACAILYAVHHKCTGCGKDHTEELLESSSDEHLPD